ncbi:LrgB family protein [Salinimicrobium tongyeongense]|uniref:LrgB family protein n=1 Tax=Salinimicrobium tongyeongense TaxID=2809707 RepID=A0ABY6NVP0_9FLAO|nr:LrgB family protein [Salinimicrobium tongyeongense]UZH56711.1 LrgB family protein [Salinimicrobium tongyeongense]
MNFFFLWAIFGIGITLVFYALAGRIKRFKIPFLNPVLLAIVGIIIFLKVFDIPFEAYNKGGKILTYFLGPAVVALGAFFYEKYEELRKDLRLLSIAVIIGGICGVVSIVVFMLLLGMPLFLIQSLAAKSVTTPIAVEITKNVGGIPDITAGIVIAVGVFGNVFGLYFLNKMGITSQRAIGAALGTAAHGIGTARAIEEGVIPGVYSGIAMCLNGIVTAVSTPVILHLIL